MKSRSLIMFDNSKDLGNWYNKKYAEMGSGWSIPKEEALRLVEWAEFTKDKTKRLLDIGCGDGDFISHIIDYAICFGIDLSEYGIELAQKREIQGAFFSVGDIEQPGDVPPFDYLTSIGSIEHCINIPKALKKCFEILKDDGKFLCMVPNELWLYDDQPQEQTHTDKEWSKLFIDAGFKIAKQNRRNDLTDFLLIK